MKSKKSKPLTVRQQIQQCPLLTPEERSLALFGLRKASHVQPMWNSWKPTRESKPNDLSYAFSWERVSVVKGNSPIANIDFWSLISEKLDEWKQSVV